MHEVLSTDYDNYAVIYGCYSPWWAYGLISFRSINLLSREPFLAAEHVRAAKEALMKVNYNYNYWL